MAGTLINVPCNDNSSFEHRGVNIQSQIMPTDGVCSVYLCNRGKLYALNLIFYAHSQLQLVFGNVEKGGTLQKELSNSKG